MSLRISNRGMLVALYGLGLVAVSSPVRAGGLLLESYVGERPDEAEKVLVPMFKELASRDYTTGAQAAQALVADLGAGSDDPTDAELKALSDRVAAAEGRYFQGSLEDAAAAAGSCWTELRRWSGFLARNQDQRSLLRRALVVYAESQQQLRAADEKTRALAELARAFPDQPLTIGEHSPEMVREFRQVEHSNERPGRVREVEIKPGARAQLTIAWALDSSVRARGSFAGFSFVDEAERRSHEADNAARVARALDPRHEPDDKPDDEPGVEAVIVVGIRPYKKRRALIGVVVSRASGRVTRSGHLPLEPDLPSSDQVRELARFLAGDERAGPFAPVVEKPLRAGAEGALVRPLGLLKWTALSAGVATMATGGTLIAIHREMPPDRQVPYTRNSRPAGLVTLSVGAAVIGLGAYLFVRHRRARRALERPRKPAEVALKPVVAATAHGLAFGLTGRF